MSNAIDGRPSRHPRVQREVWVFVITAVATFMVTLDSLVVTTALPAIQRDLGASLAGLQWTVNAYTLPFAVLLLTGAALGDRYGRRRLFCIGLGVFTSASAAAALAGTTSALITARALQGAGGAIVAPLTLTILSEAVPRGRRGLALGAWGAISGLAIAIGPLIGGTIVDGMSWQWIFLLNVPIGLSLLPLAALRLSESTGPDAELDLVGLGLAGTATGGVVFGLVRASNAGGSTLQVAAPIVFGLCLLVAFIAWEARVPAPMIPMGLFGSRTFAAANATSMLMFLGMFGSMFLLAQFLQGPLGYSPFEAGIRTLPWTGAMVIVAPLAGILSDRVGSRPLIATGMGLLTIALADLARLTTPTVPYRSLVLPFVLAGVGMSLFFAPTANAVLASVGISDEGKASGVLNTLRQLGAVLGVAVLSAVFAAEGGTDDAIAFSKGVAAALWMGAAVSAIGTITAMLIPGRAALAAPAAVPDLRVTAGLAPELVREVAKTSVIRRSTRPRSRRPGFDVARRSTRS